MRKHRLASTPKLNVFTIARNAAEFLPIIERNLRLSGVPYRWCVAEGYAKPVKDGSWCRDVPGATHSTDATRRWLASSTAIVVSRDVWNGKVEMCNAALAALRENGATDGELLLQVDADEIWEPWQIRELAILGIGAPKGAEWRFWCQYYVGPKLVINGQYCWGNRPDIDWRRMWKLTPASEWERHEPPVLKGRTTIFDQEHSRVLGLVFKHFAYVSEEQVAFKERYYGYDGLLAGWRAMNELKVQDLPKNLNQFMRGTDGVPVVPAEKTWQEVRDGAPEEKWANRAHLVGHQGLGDQIILAGMAATLAQQGRRPVVYCKPEYYDSVLDIHATTGAEVRTAPAGQHGEGALWLVRRSTGFTDLVHTGWTAGGLDHQARNGRKFDEVFYAQAGMDPALRWSWVAKSSIFPQVPAPGGTYFFVHEDQRRNFRINRRRLPVVGEFLSSEMRKTRSILQWLNILRKASEVHVIDSAFLNLVVRMEDRPRKVVWHRYARPTSDEVSVPPWVEILN